MIDEKDASHRRAQSKGKIVLAALAILIVVGIVVAMTVLPGKQSTGLKEGEIRTAPALSAWNTGYDGVHKVDSRQIELGPDQGMEFKYKMAKGDGMVYSWEAPVKLQFEFHGEPEGSPKGTYESYAIDDAEGVHRGSGTFIAPFTGIHGWYWKNTTDQNVTIQLTSSGFYTGGKEFRKGFQGDHTVSEVPMGAK